MPRIWKKLWNPCARRPLFCPDRDPYEVWLDRYEHGLTIAQCDAFFAALRETIVPLLAAIKERGSAIRTDFCIRIGPLSSSASFPKRSWKCGGWTTAYWAKPSTPLPPASGTAMCALPRPHAWGYVLNLYSVAHEGGHALYELNVDPKYDYTTLAGGATAGLHESPSRLFENYVGRSRAFIHYLYPTLLELFPQQLNGVTEEEIYRAVNRAEPSLIRTRRRTS